MGEKVVINDVGPRDGLQNQPKILSIEERLRLIQSLVDANVKHIEVGSFVSPKAVPAMAGTDQVVQSLDKKAAEFSALIPNMRGYDLAVEAGATSVAMVLYGSDGMAEKNVRMTRLQADQATEAILKQAQQDNVEVIATIAVAFVCPFDGPTDPAIVQATTGKFLELGASQLVVADTIGATNPLEVKKLMGSLAASFGPEKTGLPLSRHPRHGAGQCICRAGSRYPPL